MVLIKELIEFIVPIILFGIFIVIVDLLESKKDRKVEKVMALIECPECGKQISDKSKVCIHCGYPIEEMKSVLLEANNEQKIDMICPHCNSKSVDEQGYCNDCGMKVFTKEIIATKRTVSEKSKNRKVKNKKVRKKKKRIFPRIIFFVFIIACISLSNEREEEHEGLQEANTTQISGQVQTEILFETDVEKRETQSETEVKTEMDPISKLHSVFSKHMEVERCDLLCEILFSSIGFEEVKFIKKVDNSFNYEVWLDGQKGLITDTGDDFRIFIPNTDIIFYEHQNVIMDAEEFESRTIKHDDIGDYYIIAKSIVEGNLKNPRSAKFPSLLTNSAEIGMSKLGDLICVQSYVDATNSFGAKVRTNWTVQFTVINLNSFSYELNYIKIGDESAGEFISMK